LKYAKVRRFVCPGGCAGHHRRGPGSLPGARCGLRVVLRNFKKISGILKT
jgi:hypothetical protein